jgi:hypothetical protein
MDGCAVCLRSITGNPDPAAEDICSSRRGSAGECPDVTDMFAAISLSLEDNWEDTVEILVSIELLLSTGAATIDENAICFWGGSEATRRCHSEPLCLAANANSKIFDSCVSSPDPLVALSSVRNNPFSYPGGSAPLPVSYVA